MLYIEGDLLAATSTASAFTLIGPASGYAGVHTWAESVCQNCVLERCANLCSIIVLHQQVKLAPFQDQNTISYPPLRTISIKVLSLFKTIGAKLPSLQEYYQKMHPLRKNGI